MDKLDTLLEMTKDVIGITTDVRDNYLRQRVKATIDMLEKEKNVTIDFDNFNHLLFIADYTAWQYKARDREIGMPEHLLARLKNIYIKGHTENV